MNCCNWEWLKYSTVLLFPHDFTRVDHQEENSIIITLRDKIRPVQPLYRDFVWYLLLSWNDAGGLKESRVSSSRDVTLGCPSGGLLGAVWRSKFFLEFLSHSFRLSRVSSEIWLNVGSMFKLGQMLRLGARLEQLQVSRNARLSSRGQRERRERGSAF